VTLDIRICTVGVEIFSVVTSCTFSRRGGASKCVSLVFAGGDTTVPSRLYARLCHAFSSFHKILLHTGLYAY